MGDGQPGPQGPVAVARNYSGGEGATRNPPAASRWDFIHDGYPRFPKTPRLHDSLYIEPWILGSWSFTRIAWRERQHVGDEGLQESLGRSAKATRPTPVAEGVDLERSQA